MIAKISSNKLYLRLFVIIYIFVASLRVYAGWSEFGELGVDTQLFNNDHNPLTKDQNNYFKSRLSLLYQEEISAKLSVFARQDWVEPEDSFLYLEELWIKKQLNKVQLKLGFDLYNWSVMESFHPADVINSRDFNGDIFDFKKQGEPSLYLRWKALDSYFHFYYFPFFISSKFPYEKSRFSLTSLTTNLGKPEVTTSNGQLESKLDVPQFGFKWDMKFDKLECSLYYLDHLDRLQPNFYFQPVTNEIIPVFNRLVQWGGTVVYVHESLIFKAEVALKNYEFNDILVPLGGQEKSDDDQYAWGFEYNYDFESGRELSTFVEHQYIPSISRSDSSGFVPFQNDLFVGWRLSLNDIQGSEFRLFAIVDLERSQELILNFTFERRVRENWKLKLGLRSISAPPEDPNNVKGLETFDGSDYVNIGLNRYF